MGYPVGWGRRFQPRTGLSAPSEMSTYPKGLGVALAGHRGVSGPSRASAMRPAQLR